MSDLTEQLTVILLSAGWKNVGETVIK